MLDDKLNDQNVQTLAKPFTLAEHGFKKGDVYLRKSAIRRRLSKVDLLWSTGAPEYLLTDGDVVLYRGSLTVGGVTRWGVGSGIILRANKEGVVYSGFELARNIAKAHKEAVSDILARAAVEFGIGNYLKDKPTEIKQAGFADWLARLLGEKPAGQPTVQSSGQPESPEPKAWATAGSVQHLLNRCAQGLGLTWGDVSRLTGIAELEDYPAWNKYASQGAAAEAIKAALDKELAALPPASPKQPVLIT